MIKKLIKIADLLDRSGREEDADTIDEAIGMLSDIDNIEVPEDERDMLKMVLESLQRSLEEQ